MPAVPPPIVGVDRAEWDALVERGREAGELHADQIAHVLREVELTSDTLEAVTATLASIDITVDDSVAEVDDPTPPRGSRGVVIDEEDVERLLTRRRRRRGQKRATRVDAGTSDTVRMYLREIGQVDLLTAEDERRLAQLIEEGHHAAERIDEGIADEAESRLLMRAVSRGERAKVRDVAQEPEVHVRRQPRQVIDQRLHRPPDTAWPLADVPAVEANGRHRMPVARQCDRRKL